MGSKVGWGHSTYEAGAELAQCRRRRPARALPPRPAAHRRKVVAHRGAARARSSRDGRGARGDDASTLVRDLPASGGVTEVHAAGRRTGERRIARRAIARTARPAHVSIMSPPLAPRRSRVAARARGRLRRAPRDRMRAARRGALAPSARRSGWSTRARAISSRASRSCPSCPRCGSRSSAASPASSRARAKSCASTMPRRTRASTRRPTRPRGSRRDRCSSAPIREERGALRCAASCRS